MARPGAAPLHAQGRSPTAGRPDPTAGMTAGRLRRINLALGVAHLLQGGLILSLSNGLALPVTAGWLQGDPVAAGAPSPPEEVFSLPIGPAVAVFLFLAASSHFVAAAPGLHPWYARLVAEGRNYLRWIEYSVSASLMMVLIARFTGIADLAALIGIFGLTACMILFGLLMERQQQPGGADWSAFWFGSLAGGLPWLTVTVYLWNGASPPGFVYVIYVVQFIFFSSFAVNMALQYRLVGPWRDYRFGELAYAVLSLSAKSALAWLIFANVLRS